MTTISSKKISKEEKEEILKKHKEKIRKKVNQENIKK